MNIIHYVEYYKVAEHKMHMPFCGLDDNGKCFFTEKKEQVTCKKCLTKLKTRKGVK